MAQYKSVIFTDLDGTLIDFETYSSALTKPYVSELAKQGVLIVFCSSKTFAEQRVLQEELGIEMPCIVENGSAIVSPEGFWDDSIWDLPVAQGWSRIELGSPANAIIRKLNKVESAYGGSLMGFNSLMTEDVSALTGLDLISARRAQEREYSETLAIELPEDTWRSLDIYFKREGLKCLPGGRFHTVISENADKGTAIREFGKRWAAQSDLPMVSLGLGDSENDKELLESVDSPYLVKRPSGDWAKLSGSRLDRVDGIGPEGWVQVAKRYLSGSG